MTDMLIRSVDSEIARQLRVASVSRGMSLAQYITQLVILHQQIRARADAGDDGLQAELKALRLKTVDNQA